ncbi:MAG: hypothetical protein IT497_01150 [Ottowia sp.]|nr:hypothetical protein [Ottowia sp.]
MPEELKTSSPALNNTATRLTERLFPTEADQSAHGLGDNPSPLWLRHIRSRLIYDELHLSKHKRMLNALKTINDYFKHSVPFF